MKQSIVSSPALAIRMGSIGVCLMVLGLLSAPVESAGVKDSLSALGDWFLAGAGNKSAPIQPQVSVNINNNKLALPEAVPICGSKVFESSKKDAVAPKIIMISTKDDVEREFNAINSSMRELKSAGFRPEVPTTFIIHGFTSGYPYQSWMTSIVELFKARVPRVGSGTGYDYYANLSSFTTSRDKDDDSSSTTTPRRNETNYANYVRYLSESSSRSRSGRPKLDRQSSRDRDSLSSSSSSSSSSSRRSQSTRYNQNLFAVNWHYAAKGIVYPRAVANMPFVASHLIAFIDRLTEEGEVDGKSITIIGHSLGAHLAGYVGKNTKQRIGRIYGLDPAGPCFGTVTGKLFPSSRRLSPTDADEVITVHTNSALLGIGEPLGSKAIFVEGGAVQPGCEKPVRSVIDSLENFRYDGDSTIGCSHARAPQLMANERDPTCHLMAYECKDWESFERGYCGECDEYNNQCYRLGLDWQYDYSSGSSYGSSAGSGLSRQSSIESIFDRITNSGNVRSQDDKQRRNVTSVRPRIYYAKTSDTQPFCVRMFQVIITLSSPFESFLKPQMSIVMEDENDRSLASEHFGFKRNDTEYTHLLEAAHRTGRIVTAQILSPELIEFNKIREMRINYMSSVHPYIRRRLSSRLCPQRSSDPTDSPRRRNQDAGDQIEKNHRLIFRQCDEVTDDDVD